MICLILLLLEKMDVFFNFIFAKLSFFSFNDMWFGSKINSDDIDNNSVLKKDDDIIFEEINKVLKEENNILSSNNNNNVLETNNEINEIFKKIEKEKNDEKDKQLNEIFKKRREVLRNQDEDEGCNEMITQMWAKYDVQQGTSEKKDKN